jgi:hypothetical protein
MTGQRFAMILGLVLLLLGLAGFVPPLVRPASGVHGLSLDAGTPLLFGWFGATVVHNLVYGLIGAWGIVSARGRASADRWAGRAAAIFLLLMLCGVVPGFDTMFGLMPLYGNDIWLNFLLAALCAYFGWIHHDPARADDLEALRPPL